MGQLMGDDYLCFLNRKTMSHTSLQAITPIDGRYAAKTKSLIPYFSEAALIQYRVRVEIEYFLALVAIPLPQLKDFDLRSGASLARYL